MKKKLILALSTIALVGGSLTLALSAKAPAIVSAEGESSISEESEVESSVVEDSSAGAVSSSAVVSESKEEEGVVEKYYTIAIQWVEDKVVPLFAGTTIVSALSMGIALVTAFIKSKGDKKNALLIQAQDEVVSALQSKVAELKQENEAYRAYTEQLMEEFKIAMNETSITMEQVANYAKTMAELVADQNGKIEKVEKMKDAIDASCELIAKSLAVSEVAVKSGIAKDAQRLVANLKEVSNNGAGE